jgi:signal transduction histidine kinase
VTSPATRYVDRLVAPAALGRAVLLGRAAVTLTAAAVGLRLGGDPRPLLVVMAVVVVTTAAGLAAVSHDPRVVRHRAPAVALDFAVVLVVLAVSRGGVSYFCCAAGASALAGVLVGMRALVMAAVHAGLGYLVAASVLSGAAVPPAVAGFVLTFPIACVLAAVGAAAATTALRRYVDLSVEVVASAQRSAAASERARLARELHDSVAKTLRGISFAALALPSSLRRHPALAEKLAGSVSRGAEVAAQEARELLDGLRLDIPDQDFPVILSRICREWSRDTGIPVELTVSVAEPPVAVRYELCRILQEALRNVGQHARACRVSVGLDRTATDLRLRVRDDGVGFPAFRNSAEGADGFRTPADGGNGFRTPADSGNGFRTPADSGNHYGLVGMRERASTVGGTLGVSSVPGVGTTVEVLVPVAALVAS